MNLTFPQAKKDRCSACRRFDNLPADRMYFVLLNMDLQKVLETQQAQTGPIFQKKETSNLFHDYL